MVLQKVMIFFNYGNGIQKSDEKSVLWDNKPLVQWNGAESHQCINCFRVKTISNFSIRTRDPGTWASPDHDHKNFKISDRTRTKKKFAFSRTEPVRGSLKRISNNNINSCIKIIFQHQTFLIWSSMPFLIQSAKGFVNKLSHEDFCFKSLL